MTDWHGEPPPADWHGSPDWQARATELDICLALLSRALERSHAQYHDRTRHLAMLAPHIHDAQARGRHQSRDLVKRALDACDRARDAHDVADAYQWDKYQAENRPRWTRPVRRRLVIRVTHPIGQHFEYAAQV